MNPGIWGPLDPSTVPSFSYLRLSLTDRCNFRCSYCLPEAIQQFHPLEGNLNLPEWKRLLPLLAACGIRKVRLTGGEPSLHPHLLEVVRLLRALGIGEKALTTNGFRLERIAGDLAAAGLTRVNVHLDSTDPETFDRASQTSGLFHRVVAGIRAAKAAGFAPVKVNAVLMRGVNDGEMGVFVDFAEREGVEVRFIELMPTGTNGEFFHRHFLPVSEARRVLEEKFGLTPLPRDPLGGPSRRYKVRGREALVGFIGASCEGFCDGCQRLRLTSEGLLKKCLFEPGGFDMKALLYRGLSEREMLGELSAHLGGKRTFNPHLAGPVLEPFPMAKIGG